MGNVVIAPLTLQKYNKEEFGIVIDQILAELEAMDGNIDGTINKIGSGLTDSILDTDNYYLNVMAAESITYGLDAISKIASMITAIKGWKESYEKLYTGLTKLGSMFSKKDADILGGLTHRNLPC
jgi:hypothetical protein